MKFLKLFFLLSSISCLSQSLVQDGGFEEFKFCPRSYGGKIINLKHWINPASKSTPDVYNRCCVERIRNGQSAKLCGVPHNLSGVSETVEGDGYSGIILYNSYDTMYSEYVQTRLLSPLLKDSVYVLSFCFKSASYSTFLPSNLGVLLSRKQVSSRGKALKLKSTSYVKGPLNNFNKWRTFSFNYMAEGGEEFLTIGRFLKDDGRVLYERAFVRNYKITYDDCAYVYLDKVSIVPLSSDSMIVSSCERIESKTIGDTLCVEEAKFFDKDSMVIFKKLLGVKKMKIRLIGSEIKTENALKFLVSKGVEKGRVLIALRKEEELKYVYFFDQVQK